MKMRKCLLLTMLAGLAACNTMNYQASAPTAAPELVAELQNELKEIQDLKVTDEGYIDYYVGYQKVINGILMRLRKADTNGHVKICVIC